MKKTTIGVMMMAALAVSAVSCRKEGCTDPNAINYNEDAKKDDGSCTFATEGLVELSGDLSTQTLTKDKKYLLRGQVFVRNGRTLTIEPGTIILGDKATKGTLIIDRGGKMIADGTKAEPIVFTSALPAGQRDKGDWGGLIILGFANQNQPDPAVEGITPNVFFGGNDDNDNSGVLRYVRVEFGGIELTPNNETNSITMGAVGRGTVMEYAMVSFGGDDGFEWFGGANDGKYLISYGMWDDDFDVDYGYSGKNQFGLAVRYPSFADQSGSNIFECDNGPNDDVTSLLTTGTFTNFTGIGPRLENGQTISGNNQHALDLRRRTAVTIANSVFIGMPRGLRMNQTSVFENYDNGTGVLANNILCAPSNIFLSGGTHSAQDVENYWLANGNTVEDGTDFAAIIASLGLNQNIFFGNNLNTNYSSNPTFTVTSGQLASGADFSHSKLAGFETVSFRGAFGSTDWTEGWVEWNPIMADY
ncbi:MAG: hypothetical protein JJT77_00285 [Crocinitomicaceae bacterium]|nr:hypothetical protein [Crocinitomicaceae bacterium]